MMNGKWIGFGVLWPWLRYRFASRNTTPRLDEQGRVYMLLCDAPTPPPREQGDE